jgi:flagellar biosynthesis protein FliQ
MGMQQGLAFYPSMLLLKVFLIFNGSVLHERIIHYAPHISIQAYNTIN